MHMCGTCVSDNENSFLAEEDVDLIGRSHESLANDTRGWWGAAAAQGDPAAGQPVVAAAPVAVVVVAAPVARPVIANMAGAFVQPGLVHPRFDVEAVLAGPVPRKSNIGCEIHARIDDRL
jgi:hypothetical protein